LNFPKFRLSWTSLRVTKPPERNLFFEKNKIMPQAHSATQLLAFQERKLGFITMINDKPLLISVSRSLLFYCTVLSNLMKQCQTKQQPKFKEVRKY
jgi:hypothetical protein